MDPDDQVDFNIEAEDLDELPPVPAAPEQGPPLVIEHEDLTQTAPPGKSLPPQPPIPGSAPLAERPVTQQFSYKPSLTGTQMLGRGMISLALAGALGGLLAWMATEPFMNDAQQRDSDVSGTLLRMGLFGGLLGGLIGAALSGAEGLGSRVPEKFLRGFGLGLLIGFMGGAVGGVCGQLIYGGLGGGGGVLGLQQIIIRSLGWSLVGIGVGMAQGASALTPRRLINGVLGGGLGGFVGGLLFDPLAALGQAFVGGEITPHAGWFSRMLAMVVLGGCTGAAISLVEELRKEAWLIVMQGGLAGKQFILYKPVTVVGSSPKADICLLKDPGIRPQHCVLQETAGGHVLLASPECPVLVNGRAANHRRLAEGDTLTLGQTVVEYHVRAVRAWAPARTPAQAQVPLVE